MAGIQICGQIQHLQNNHKTGFKPNLLAVVCPSHTLRHQRSVQHEETPLLEG